MKKLQLLVGGASALSMGSVFAAVPAEVTTAIETAGTDSVTVASAVLAVIVGIFAIKLMRRSL